MSTRTLSGYFGGYTDSPAAGARVDIELLGNPRLPYSTLTVGAGIDATTGLWTQVVPDTTTSGRQVRIVETVYGSFMSANDYTIPVGSPDGQTLTIADLSPDVPTGQLTSYLTSANHRTDPLAANWGHSVATTETAGFMAAADKTKLDTVATNANAYTHPSGDGDMHVPATSTTNNGKVLKAGATAGSLSWGTLTSADVGALASSATTDSLTQGTTNLYVTKANIESKLTGAITTHTHAYLPLVGGALTGAVTSSNASGVSAFACNVSPETEYRLKVMSQGTLLWGDGTLAGDTNLYRSSANVLKTDDAFQAASYAVGTTSVIDANRAMYPTIRSSPFAISNNTGSAAWYKIGTIVGDACHLIAEVSTASGYGDGNTAGIHRAIFKGGNADNIFGGYQWTESPGGTNAGSFVWKRTGVKTYDCYFVAGAYTLGKLYFRDGFGVTSYELTATTDPTGTTTLQKLFKTMDPASFNGGLSATTGTFSSALSATTGTFSGALSATTASLSGATSVEDTLSLMKALDVDRRWIVLGQGTGSWRIGMGSSPYSIHIFHGIGATAAAPGTERLSLTTGGALTVASVNGITGLGTGASQAAAGNHTHSTYAHYDVAGMVVGKPTASLIVLRFIAPRAFTIPQNGTLSCGVAAVAATGSTTFDLKKNGVSFGSMVFAASGTTASFTVASSTAFAAGDILTVVAPGTPDATLADVAFTLAGTL